jgi:uncharacterized Fe-S cluster-containing MiaB family protein
MTSLDDIEREEAAKRWQSIQKHDIELLKQVIFMSIAEGITREQINQIIDMVEDHLGRAKELFRE